jgi:hypothetical protein
MLATVALASERDAIGVWIGATVGMVLADAVAIIVGAMLHKRLPEGFLHTMASVLFLLFGLWMLFDAALGWRVVALVTTGGVAAVVLLVAVFRAVRARRLGAASAMPRKSSSETI